MCVPANNLMKCVCVVFIGTAVQQAELNLVIELRQSSWCTHTNTHIHTELSNASQPSDLFGVLMNYLSAR